MNKNIDKRHKNHKNQLFKDKNDPLGSYTGNALDGENPVQDADDL